MNISIFSMEDCIFLQELITNNNWTDVPTKDKFFQTIEILKQNSSQLYLSYLEHFEQKCKNISFDTIAMTINDLIKGEVYE